MKKKSYEAMKKRILASMIIVPLIPFILVLAIGYFYFAGSIEKNTVATMSRVVEDHRLMIDSFLSERLTDLETVGYLFSFEQLSEPGTLPKILTLLQKKSPAFVDLGVFDQTGLHVLYQGPFELQGKLYKNQPWFMEVLQKGVYVSDVFLGFRKLPHFIIALTRQDEHKKWVLRATIDTKQFSDLVRKVRIGRTGESYLLNQQGLFQTERRSGGSLMEKDKSFSDQFAQATHIKTFIQKNEHGQAYLYAVTRLTNKNWILVVRQGKVDAFYDLSAAVNWIVIISLVGGCVIIVMAVYITDRMIRKLEKIDAEKGQLGQQLISATRLAEIGEMAAGFAHEINNPLQIIKSEQSLAKVLLSEIKTKVGIAHYPDVLELEDSLDQISKQISRSAEITQAILKFSRKSEPKFQPIDLSEYVPEIISLVEGKANVHGIGINMDIEKAIPPIIGDFSQLQQVLINLLNNAMDAIIEKHGAKGGLIDIRIAPWDTRSIQITVHDNGCGISNSNIEKIFSPFFTTKPVGKGTGLGLSVCYGIINAMGGKMEVDSTPGQGTRFTITLPAGRQNNHQN